MNKKALLILAVFAVVIKRKIKKIKLNHPMKIAVVIIFIIIKKKFCN